MVTEPVGKASECLLLKNMFDPKTEVSDFNYIVLSALCKQFSKPLLVSQTEPDFDLDIKEDVQEECSKFGRLRHIYVDK